MGEFGTSDQRYAIYTSDCSWKKLIIAKRDNDEWVSSIKIEQVEDVNDAGNSTGFSLGGEQAPIAGDHGGHASLQSYASYPLMQEPDPRSLLEIQVDPLEIHTPQRRKRSGSGSCSSIKNETDDERAARLAKMSAYAAQRLAKETPEQRAIRLKRMSEYAAKRLREETREQRAQRLARMSAYAAKRLANESPEQRQERLKRMSAYAAKRHAQKKEKATKAIKLKSSFYENTVTPDQS